MDSTPPIPDAIGDRKEFSAARRRYFVAMFNLFFVVAMASVIFFGMAPESGAIADPASDNLILMPIRVVCVVGCLAAGGAWLYSWYQLLGLDDRAQSTVRRDR